MQLFFIPAPGASGGAVDWQPNVIDIQSAPPGAPNDGDRYIVLPAGAGAWAGQDNNIATWDAGAAAWVFTTPENGWATVVEASGLIYIFNGVSWNALSAESEYRQSFVDGDLVGGVLTVVHNLGQRYHSVTVYDNNGDKVAPNNITDVDLNTVDVDVASFVPLTGTWNVVVGG